MQKLESVQEERRQEGADMQATGQEDLKEMLRKEQEKKERKTRKRMLEESWQVARRTTDYIDENLERWQSE